jgi:hypothetical protein
LLTCFKFTADPFGDKVSTQSIQKVASGLYDPSDGSDTIFKLQARWLDPQLAHRVRRYLAGHGYRWETRNYIWDSVAGEELVDLVICASFLTDAGMHASLMTMLRHDFIERDRYPGRRMMVHIWSISEASDPIRKLVIDAIYLHFIAFELGHARFLESSLFAIKEFQTLDYMQGCWLPEVMTNITAKVSLDKISDPELRRRIEQKPDKNLGTFKSWLHAVRLARREGCIKDDDFFHFIDETDETKRQWQVYDELVRRGYTIQHTLPVPKPKAVAFDSKYHALKGDKEWSEEPSLTDTMMRWYLRDVLARYTYPGGIPGNVTIPDAPGHDKQLKPVNKGPRAPKTAYELHHKNKISPFALSLIYDRRELDGPFMVYLLNDQSNATPAKRPRDSVGDDTDLGDSQTSGREVKRSKPDTGLERDHHITLINALDEVNKRVAGMANIDHPCAGFAWREPDDDGEETIEASKDKDEALDLPKDTEEALHKGKGEGSEDAEGKEGGDSQVEEADDDKSKGDSE